MQLSRKKVGGDTVSHSMRREKFFVKKSEERAKLLTFPNFFLCLSRCVSESVHELFFVRTVPTPTPRDAPSLQRRRDVDERCDGSSVASPWTPTTPDDDDNASSTESPSQSHRILTRCPSIPLDLRLGDTRRVGSTCSQRGVETPAAQEERTAIEPSDGKVEINDDDDDDGCCLVFFFRGREPFFLFLFSLSLSRSLRPAAADKLLRLRRLRRFSPPARVYHPPGLQPLPRRGRRRALDRERVGGGGPFCGRPGLAPSSGRSQIARGLPDPLAAFQDPACAPDFSGGRGLVEAGGAAVASAQEELGGDGGGGDRQEGFRESEEEEEGER